MVQTYVDICSFIYRQTVVYRYSHTDTCIGKQPQTQTHARVDAKDTGKCLLTKIQAGRSKTDKGQGVTGLWVHFPWHHFV
jgi:hypothetical protein